MEEIGTAIAEHQPMRVLCRRRLANIRELQRWVSLLMNIKMCYKRNRLEEWLFH